MIEYEFADSPHFEANRAYAEAACEHLSKSGADCEGWCNSYGYDIDANWTEQDLRYRLSLNKYQSTQGQDSSIPFDADAVMATKISVAGLTKKLTLSGGNSRLKRLFCSSNLKRRAPSPLYIFGIGLSKKFELDHIVTLLVEHHKAALSLKRGIFMFEMLGAPPDTLRFITEIRDAVRKWA